MLWRARENESLYLTTKFSKFERLTYSARPTKNNICADSDNEPSHRDLAIYRSVFDFKVKPISWQGLIQEWKSPFQKLKGMKG